MSNIYVKLTTDNTITAGINYKQQYDCKCDRGTLTNNTQCKRAFRFFKYFGLKVACIGRN